MRRLVFALLAAGVTATVGCNLTINVPKKSTEPTETTPTTAAVDDRNTNYRPDQSVLRNSKRAGERLAQQHQFDQLGTIMFALELQDSRMPTVQAVKDDLKANPDAKDLLKLIDDGVIILTGTTDRQGLWAYEIDADKAGGIILVSGRARRAQADEVKQYLGKK
jgi:hypothetical protein